MLGDAHAFAVQWKLRDDRPAGRHRQQLVREVIDQCLDARVPRQRATEFRFGGIGEFNGGGIQINSLGVNAARDPRDRAKRLGRQRRKIIGLNRL